MSAEGIPSVAVLAITTRVAWAGAFGRVIPLSTCWRRAERRAAMRGLATVVAVSVLGLCLRVTALGDTVVDFESLGYGVTLTGSGYAGLDWEAGGPGASGNLGDWITPSEGGAHDYPHSGQHNILNSWGSTEIGIGFPERVDVLGAWVGTIGHYGGNQYVHTQVCVHGYRDGLLVQSTDWFQSQDYQPQWFDMALTAVDRIVFESRPVNHGGGYYHLDDLTYIVPEPATFSLLFLGGLAVLCRSRS